MSNAPASLPDDPQTLRRWVRSFAERYLNERDRVHRLSERLGEVKQECRRYREQCAAVWDLVRDLERFREAIPDGPEALKNKCFLLKARNQELREENKRLRREKRALKRQLANQRSLSDGERLGRAVVSGEIELRDGMSRGDLEGELALWAEQNTDMEHTSQSTVRRRLQDAGLLGGTYEETVRLCRTKL